MARKKGDGTLVKRRGKFLLKLVIDGKPRLKLITDLKGSACTNIVDARKHAPAAEDSIREGLIHKDGDFPVSELWQTYLTHLPNYSKRHGTPHIDAERKTRLAPATLTANESITRRFTEFLAEKKVVLRSEVNEVHASEFTARLADGKDSTYNRNLSAIRHVFSVIPQITPNPFAGLTGRTKQTILNDTAKKRRFTEDQLRIMQERATGWIRPAMFISFHSGGLRLGDVLTLKWSNYDDNGYVTLKTRKASKDVTLYAPQLVTHLAAWRERVALDYNKDNLTSHKWLGGQLLISEGSAFNILRNRRGKNQPLEECREVPAEFDSIEQWDAYIREGAAGRHMGRVRAFLCSSEPLTLDEVPTELRDYIFPRQAARYLGIGCKADRSSASKEFQRFLTNECGFDTRDANGQTVLGFHSLSVSSATTATNAGQGIKETQRQLAHSNERVTAGYIQPTEEEKRETIRRNYVPLAWPGDGVRPQENDEREALPLWAETLLQQMTADNWKEIRDEVLR